MIIAEFIVVPVGTGSSGVSRYVKAAVEELKKQGGIRVEVGAMGTVIEAKTLHDLFKAVEQAHNAVFETGIQRIVTEIKIDERRDKDVTIESKVGALR